MSQVIRRLALSRRHFLRGSSAVLALPFLDAMVPALAATGRPGPGEGPARCLFIFAPNGKRMDLWTPKKTGRGFELPPSLEPLAPVREQVTVFSGLAIDGGRPHGDGPGDHARAAGSFLTCAHPKKTGGADIQAGISVDQVLAAKLGGNTTFASLELGIDGGRRGGSCDSGYSCAYSNNISWKSPSSPVAKETRPADVFARLFGDPKEAQDAAERVRRTEEKKSILDVVLADAKSLRKDLAAPDRNKLDEYLEAVRDLEKRVAKTAAPAGKIPGAEKALEGGTSRADRIRQMFDLITLAFRADLVRVATFMLGNAGANESFPFLGLSGGHHDTSHHGKDEAKIAALAKIDRFHVERLAAFLQGLEKVEDGGKSLLHRSIILYGAGISDGDRHNHDDLPVLLAGGGNGKCHPGRHEKLPFDTPMANLHLAILNAMGAPETAFADSKAVLEI